MVVAVVVILGDLPPGAEALGRCDSAFTLSRTH